MSNLPIKRETGLIYKLKMFFYKILGKNKANKNNKKPTRNRTETEKIAFQETLQYDMNAINNKKYIIEQIDKYPSILNKLQPERLKGIKILYDEVLEKEQKEIRELEEKVRRLEEEAKVG